MRNLAIALLIAAFLGPHACATAGEKDGLDWLLARLRAGDGKAIPAVVKHGTAAVPGLRKILHSGMPVARGHALAALAELGPDGREAIPGIATIMRSDDDVLGMQAALTLARLGPAAVPEILETLRSGSPRAAERAARAAERLGSAAKGASPLLVERLKKAGSAREKSVYVDALGTLGPAAADAVPALLALGRADPTPPAVIYVVVALGRIGPAARAAGPFLGELLSSKSAPPHVRLHALEALSRVDVTSKELARALDELMKGPGFPRAMVFEALGNVQTLGKDVLHIVEVGLRDRDPSVRLAAARVVGRADRDHRTVVTGLMDALNEKGAPLRRRAVEIIGEVRPTDPAIPAALRRAAADDPDRAVRAAAAEALERFARQ
jgi:HEAT repeat protein